MDVKFIDELDAADLAKISASNLAKLEDAKLGVPTLADTIAQTFGARPHLVIDITDPPTPPRANACGVESTGANADECVKALAADIAGEVRGRAAELDIDVGQAVP